MKILLTAFEPFGGDAVNPTQAVADALAENPPDGFVVVVRHLPVVADDSVVVALDAFERERPDAMISLGLSAGSASIALERIAINLDDFRIPDNAGGHRIDLPIVANGPAAYWTTLPIRRIWNRLLAEGIPAHVSNSAGTYVCNHLFYLLLHEFHRRNVKLPFGFIHIPYLPEQAARKTPAPPSLALETVVNGIGWCLRELKTNGE